MRLFVCEFVTGGGMAGKIVQGSLRAEGDLMLRSLVKDLAELDSIDLVISRDRRFPAKDLDLKGDILWIEGARDPWFAWAKMIEKTDALWPIAPETDGLLERLSQMAIAAGRGLIGSRPGAIRLSASKSATALTLAEMAIPVLPVAFLSAAGIELFKNSRHGWVVKPDDGAGAEATRRILRHRDLMALSSREDSGRFILQPFLPGEVASVSLVCLGGEMEVLSCNRQHVEIENGCFRYRGWEVGGMEGQRQRLEPIAQAVVSAIPGLQGYCGIDFILSEQGPLVLDINPRLTTTYAALRDTIGCNPAALVLGRQPLNLRRSLVRSTAVWLASHG